MALGQIDIILVPNRLQGQRRAGGVLPDHRRVPASQNADGFLLNQLIGKAGTGGFQRRQRQINVSHPQQLLQIGGAFFR